jgi:hypothetical protein
MPTLPQTRVLYVRLTLPDFNGFAPTSSSACRVFTSLKSAFSAAQEKGTHHQSQLIDKTNIHQTGYQDSATDHVHVLTRLLLDLSNFFHIAHDPRRLPRNFVESPGKYDV